MSAASDVTSEPDAERPAADGAAFADAMTQERAPHAMDDHGADRDRNPLDDANIQAQSREAVEAQLVQPLCSTAAKDVPSLLSKQEYLEIIKEARQLVKKAASISTGSAKDYARKSQRMLSEFEKLSGNNHSRWTAVLRRFASKANTFFAMRAAATWQIREELRTLLTAARAQIEIARGNVANFEWHTKLMQIEQHTALLRAVQSIGRSDALRWSGDKSSKVKSKRADLHRFSADWADRMVRASEYDAYGEAIWVLANTGCRPQELVDGVELRPEFDRITVRIKGAKVGVSSGQAWRELDVSWRSVTFSFGERLGGRESVAVRVSSTAGLRKAVAAVGKRLWPASKGRVPAHGVSPQPGES